MRADSGLQYPQDASYVQPQQDAAVYPDAYVPPPQDAGVTIPPGTCEPTGGPAAPPAIAATFASGTAPAMSGGSPVGVWAATNVTVYLPASAAGLVDTTMSSLTGTAWFSFDAAGNYNLSIDVNANIASIIGAIMQRVQTKSIGTYSPSGANLGITALCLTGGEGLGMATPMISFTAAAGGSSAQFLIQVSTMYMGFPIDIVLLANANRVG